ncbi:4Fe-4S binding protein [Clostridium sp. JS66]|uniref:4Fe-4S binding protein n=1 Tax=Clostridium sp. JS66 TaxID=3064705 RepID=UPI00298EA549|nr:4Fe-4S binding protein [Clostridium sp. JS66]WPC44779.1 4Fe-4S binding protein [Clostridium sp. JS66]
MKVDADKCINCKRCIKACPMNVDILDPRRNRKNGTECILCLKCSKVCPKKAIRA